jgi:hypothetical protein
MWLMTWRERCSCALELPGRFCHRRLVAEWLEKNLLIEVPELDVPKATRSIQRELWSFL